MRIAALLGFGLTCCVLAVMVARDQGRKLAERPAASGDVGAVVAYADGEGGQRFALQPGALAALRRPQELAFTWTAKGTGPRIVRIELEWGAQRRVVHETQLGAPANGEALGYVLHLGDEVPDRVRLAITVEAPHARSVQSGYPLALGGDKACHVAAGGVRCDTR